MVIEEDQVAKAQGQCTEHCDGVVVSYSRSLKGRGEGAMSALEHVASLYTGRRLSVPKRLAEVVFGACRVR